MDMQGFLPELYEYEPWAANTTRSRKISFKCDRPNGSHYQIWFLYEVQALIKTCSSKTWVILVGNELDYELWHIWQWKTEWFGCGVHMHGMNVIKSGCRCGVNETIQWKTYSVIGEKDYLHASFSAEGKGNSWAEALRRRHAFVACTSAARRPSAPSPAQLESKGKHKRSKCRKAKTEVLFRDLQNVKAITSHQKNFNNTKAPMCVQTDRFNSF